jgi:hypothetical protein
LREFFSLSRYSGERDGERGTGSIAQLAGQPLSLTLSPEYGGEGTGVDDA